jgi:hypothetical protein
MYNRPVATCCCQYTVMYRPRLRTSSLVWRGYTNLYPNPYTSQETYAVQRAPFYTYRGEQSPVRQYLVPSCVPCCGSGSSKENDAAPAPERKMMRLRHQNTLAFSISMACEFTIFVTLYLNIPEWQSVALYLPYNDSEYLPRVIF